MSRNCFLQRSRSEGEAVSAFMCQLKCRRLIINSEKYPVMSESASGGGYIESKLRLRTETTEKQLVSATSKNKKSGCQIGSCLSSSSSLGSSGCWNLLRVSMLVSTESLNSSQRFSWDSANTVRVQASGLAEQRGQLFLVVFLLVLLQKWLLIIGQSAAARPEPTLTAGAAKEEVSVYLNWSGAASDCLTLSCSPHKPPTHQFASLTFWVFVLSLRHFLSLSCWQVKLCTDLRPKG